MTEEQTERLLSLLEKLTDAADVIISELARRMLEDDFPPDMPMSS